MNSLAKILVLLLGLQLVGCSSTSFLYNRLNFIIPWYLDDYVELDKQQRGELDQLLVPFLDWHRNEELASYRVLLDTTIASLDAPATAESVAQLSRDIESAWFRLESRSIQWMLKLGEDLSDEQIQQFIAQLRKDQTKYQKKYLGRDDQEYVKDMYDNFLDNAQDFMGRLDWGQRAQLKTATANMHRSDQVWLDERAGWIVRLEQTLQRQPGWQQQVLDDLAERDESVSPEYTAVLQHNIAIIHSAIAELLNGRSDKQDKRLRRKLGDFREDVMGLMQARS